LIVGCLDPSAATGHLRLWCIQLFFFFVTHFNAQNNAPPHAPGPAILLSNLLTIADAKPWLIVALHHQMVAP
jgi:hypothetical protein